MKIKISELRKKILSTLSKRFTHSESKLIADYLIWAEMSGIKTQGLLKLTGTEPLQKIKPKHAIKIEKNTKLSQVINAGAYPAPLVSQIATDTAIKKAKQNGFGIVAVHNFFSSNGAQAFYAEKIAKENLIGITCTRSPAATTGFDSIDPLFGTNPVGFGFPTKDTPIVFDMATAAITWYGLVLAVAHGKKIPVGVAIDELGKATTDPEKAMAGAILPFDKGYKGAGLAMVIEILAGPLTSSAWIDNKTFKEEWGALFIAINPELLISTKKFKTDCSDLIRKIKNSRKRNGVKEIRLPGERSKMEYNKALDSGYVDVDEIILEELGYI